MSILAWLCRSLRHPQITVTMEVYSEVPSAKTRSALKRLGRQIGGQGLLCSGVVRASKGPVPQLERALDPGGRYWDRTSDLLGVNQIWAVAGHRLMTPGMPLNWDNDLP